MAPAIGHPGRLAAFESYHCEASWPQINKCLPHSLNSSPDVYPRKD